MSPRTSPRDKWLSSSGWNCHWCNCFNVSNYFKPTLKQQQTITNRHRLISIWELWENLTMNHSYLGYYRLNNMVFDTGLYSIHFQYIFRILYDVISVLIAVTVNNLLYALLFIRVNHVFCSDCIQSEQPLPLVINSTMSNKRQCNIYIYIHIYICWTCLW